MDERSKTQAAVAKLTDVLAGIARIADEKNRERCPYKTVEWQCTYSGGCRNQQRAQSTMMCSGDEFVRFSPTPNPNY